MSGADFVLFENRLRIMSDYVVIVVVVAGIQCEFGQQWYHWKAKLHYSHDLTSLSLSTSRSASRQNIFVLCCFEGVVWYIWCHSFDSYKRRKVIRNLIFVFALQLILKQAVHVKLRQAVHWPHAQQTLLWLRIMNFYWFWHSTCKHKQKHALTHKHVYTHM